MKEIDKLVNFIKEKLKKFTTLNPIEKEVGCCFSFANQKPKIVEPNSFYN